MINHLDKKKKKKTSDLSTISSTPNISSTYKGTDDTSITSEPVHSDIIKHRSNTLPPHPSSEVIKVQKRRPPPTPTNDSNIMGETLNISSDTDAILSQIHSTANTTHNNTTQYSDYSREYVRAFNPNISTATSINSESILRPPTPKRNDKSELFTSSISFVGAEVASPGRSKSPPRKVIPPPIDLKLDLEDSPVPSRKAVNETEILEEPKPSSNDATAIHTVHSPETNEASYFVPSINCVSPKSLSQTVPSSPTSSDAESVKSLNKMQSFETIIQHEATANCHTTDISTEEVTETVKESDCVTTEMDTKGSKLDKSDEAITESLIETSQDFMDEKEQEEVNELVEQLAPAAVISPSIELAKLEHKELAVFLESELTKLKDDLQKDQQIGKDVTPKRTTNTSETTNPISIDQPQPLQLNLDAKYKYARRALLRQYMKERMSSKDIYIGTIPLTDMKKDLTELETNTSIKLDKLEKENRELARLKEKRKNYAKELEKLENLVELALLEDEVDSAPNKLHVVDLKKQASKSYVNILQTKMDLNGKIMITSADDYVDPDALLKQVEVLKQERQKYRELVEKQKNTIKALSEDLLTGKEVPLSDKKIIVEQLLKSHSEETKSPSTSPKSTTSSSPSLPEQVETTSSKPKKVKKKKAPTKNLQGKEMVSSPSVDDGVSENSPASSNKRPSSASTRSRRASPTPSRTFEDSHKTPLSSTTPVPSSKRRPQSASRSLKSSTPIEQTPPTTKSIRRSSSCSRKDPILERIYEGGLEKQAKSREWAKTQKDLKDAKEMNELRDKPKLNRRSLEIANRRYSDMFNFDSENIPITPSNTAATPSSSTSSSRPSDVVMFETPQSRPLSFTGSVEEVRSLQQDIRRRKIREYNIKRESLAECTFTPTIGKKSLEIVNSHRSKAQKETPIHTKLFQAAKEKEAKDQLILET